MIQMPHPTMVVNSDDLGPLLRYRMWNTRLVSGDTTPFWIAANIATVATGAPGGKLAALLVNCHGVFDTTGDFVELSLGTGLAKKDLKQFGQLKGLVVKVVITACGAARGKKGKSFCGEFARKVGAYVYASEEDQKCPISVATRLNVGEIDDFEGTILRFGLAGEQKVVASVD